MILKQVVNVFDIGHLGVEKDFPVQLSSIPYRKKKNLKLTQQQEIKNNKSYSGKRIMIEYIKCRLKKYSILADLFRKKLRKYHKA